MYHRGVYSTVYVHSHIHTSVAVSKRSTLCSTSIGSQVGIVLQNWYETVILRTPHCGLFLFCCLSLELAFFICFLQRQEWRFQLQRQHQLVQPHPWPRKVTNCTVTKSKCSIFKTFISKVCRVAVVQPDQHGHLQQWLNICFHIEVLLRHFTNTHTAHVLQ